MASLDDCLNLLFTFKECSFCGTLYSEECYCSSNQRHCFHCKDALGDGFLFRRCTCMRYGSGLCLICASRYGNNLNPTSLNDSQNIFENISKVSTNTKIVVTSVKNRWMASFVINVLASLVGKVLIMVIIVHRKFRLSLIRNHAIIKPLMSSHRLCQVFIRHAILEMRIHFTYDSKPNFVDDSPNVFNPPPQPSTYSYEFCGNDTYYGHDCSPHVPFTYNPEPCYTQDFNFPQNFHMRSWQLAEYTNTPNWNRPIVYYDDDDDEDYTIAITPVLPTKEPVNSLSMGDEHLDTIPATESDEVIKSSVEDLVPIPSESEGIPDKMCDVPFCNNPTPPEAFKEHYETIIDSNNDYSSSDDDSYDNIEYVEASPPDSEIVSLEVVEIVIPEVGGIDDDILLTIKDDILREKLLNVNLLIANIKALKDIPVPSSNFVTKSPSTFPNSFLEKTNTFDNSLTESETFCFDLEENSSGSTTTLSDYSLPDYEAFYDHIKEKSSGSTTTHSEISLSKYDSFIFDLSIDSFPPTDRSDFYHEEFADELTHIISPPEYDCFCFKIEPELGNLTMDVVGDIFPTREPRVHVPNVLPTHPTLDLDLDFILFSDSIFAYIVWIFLPFLTYPVAHLYLLSCGNEDTIFDPGISVYHSFMSSVSHRSGTFMNFNVYPNNLNETLREDMQYLSMGDFGTGYSLKDKNEAKPDKTEHGMEEREKDKVKSKPKSKKVKVKVNPSKSKAIEGPRQLKGQDWDFEALTKQTQEAHKLKTHQLIYRKRTEEKKGERGVD
ncbi:hypothetical protein Tco_1033172 [Tanacetum coccineum]|uniref:Uncharacterized protein n=1 Tax=Tanacetum coccineum TaxID=301880 RepID=A0ABQ5GF94_9ASTR